MTSIEFFMLRYHEHLVALRKELDNKIEIIRKNLDTQLTQKYFKESLREIDVLMEEFQKNLKELKRQYLQALQELKRDEDSQCIEKLTNEI